MKTHSHPSYGYLYAGNQVQFDVRRGNYIRIINAFNKIETAKHLLSNLRIFSAESWDTKLPEIFSGKNPLHGYYKENVDLSKGLPVKKSILISVCTAIFTATRR